MRIKRHTRNDGATVTAAIIWDRGTVARIAPVWDSGLMPDRWAAIVAGWGIRHFRKYGKELGDDVFREFDRWADGKGKDVAEAVERYITKTLIGAKPEKFNTDYIVDLAANLFNSSRLSRLADRIESLVDEGKADEAQEEVLHFERVELGVGSGIDVFRDEAAIRAALEDSPKSMIKYPGELGKFFKHGLERGSFVSFLGPSGRGKTWWLFDLSWRAALQRLKVAFFEVGDMSEGEIMARFVARATKRPLRPQTVYYPKGIERGDDDKVATVRFKRKRFRKGVDWRTAAKELRRIQERIIRSKEPYLRLSVHPNSSISVAGIDSILDYWERQGWVPDVVVIDYADLLEPLVRTKDYRHSINETWKALRGLSQKRHCLLVTATQADAASFSSWIVRRSNFSEDRRKIDHVTGMIGINVSDAEKEKDQCRLNWIKLRNASFSETKCIHVAGCLPIGNPAILSCF